MANDEYGYFWNSNEHDRVYDADSFSNWLKKFFTTGVFQNDLQVTANGGMTVKVGSGYANIEGKVRIFDGEQNFTITAASGTYPRIDTVVVEKNENSRSITAKVVQGAYNGANPSATPPTRTSGIYQIVLAEIYVNAGATAITQANITDKRGDTNVCGWVVGTVTEIDLQQILAQSEAQFDAWFQEMKDQLSEDAAGNLQEEIDTANAQIASLANISEVHVVTEAGTDLDDYTTQGIYYFAQEFTPVGIPVGVNGYLIVLPSGDGNFVKQIWSRSGTPDSNDNMTYTREYSVYLGRWGGWTEFVTERRLNALTHITTYATTNEGSGIYFQGGGTTIIGAGECAREIVDNNINGAKSGTSECVHIGADNTVFIYSNCQDIFNRKTVVLTSTGNLNVLDGGINAKGAIKSDGKTCYPITYRDIEINLHTASWSTATNLYYTEVNVSGWQWIYGLTIGNWGGLAAMIQPYIVSSSRIGIMASAGSFPSSNAMVIVRIMGTRTSGD